MKKRGGLLLVIGAISLALSSCAFKELGNFRLIGYNATEDIEKTQCTFTFHTNGGTPVEPRVFDQGREVTLENITTSREGHEFLWWCIDEKLTTPVDKVLIPNGTRNIDLYAYWSADLNMPKFYYGYYPKSLVSNSSLLSILNEMEPSVEDGKHYDITYNGNKYRKVQSKVDDAGPKYITGTWMWFEYDYLIWD